MSYDDQVNEKIDCTRKFDDEDTLMVEYVLKSW